MEDQLPFPGGDNDDSLSTPYAMLLRSGHCPVIIAVIWSLSRHALLLWYAFDMLSRYFWLDMMM